ncbi:MAG: bifunctional diaminohydroxyphosphoribosylaminopyrimidine deaminase/5-amino-6-(5-phosphoribosylamino)uracil reductase RibD [Candidatus Cloacimonetes bacterium]|nr:bifunctional diaminohydroxyphosphoribosylaminopyrimidine deaminase/5-amino-6-(5-phosphoribosylamino)uracil reductase RibD [Candidatus Cloacimonadota bacterium]
MRIDTMNGDFTPLDYEAMTLAINLAKKGANKVSPNPLVGAVIVKNQKIIASGYHKGFGKDHAEVDAIKNCGEDLQGACIYVSLEPCNHYGKTPPCTKAIVDAGFAKVVCAVLDPNPKAQGGLEYLKSQGIECFNGLMFAEAVEINKVFFINQLKKRPKISVKLAQTLNGKISRADGTSQWITKKNARKEVHRQRANHQAILVGKSTLREDNPLLNVRHIDGDDPMIVIIDPIGDLDASLKVFSAPKVLYYSQKSRQDLQEHIIQVDVIKSLDYKKAWDLVLEDLYHRGVDSLYVEGGSTVSTYLLNNNLVDELYLFFGMKFFPSNGKDGFLFSQDKEFKLLDTKILGDSVLLRGDFGCLQELLKSLAK